MTHLPDTEPAGGGRPWDGRVVRAPAWARSSDPTLSSLADGRFVPVTGAVMPAGAPHLRRPTS
jgi:hypothetical protein